MAKKKIDLSDIKEKSLEETTTFQDLMTKLEKRRNKKKIETDDIEEMVNEKRKSEENLKETVNEKKEKKIKKSEKKNELKKIFTDDENDDNNKKKNKKNKSESKKKVQELKNEVSEKNDNTKEINIKPISTKDKTDESFLSKTQILEITRKMKFNFDDIAINNVEKKKNGFSLLNTIGIINLICIGFYIYLLVFSSYQDNEISYLIAGSIIISLVLFFGISIVTNKKISKVFKMFNIISIIIFICFNIYILIK